MRFPEWAGSRELLTVSSLHFDIPVGLQELTRADPALNSSFILSSKAWSRKADEATTLQFAFFRLELIQNIDS